MTDKYTSGVKHGIKASKYIVILLVLICAAAIFLFKKKPSGFIPSEDGGRLYLTYQLPEASSTTQSVEVITKLMNIVGATPGVDHYSAISGLNIVNSGATSNCGTIFCMLAPWEKRTKPEEQVPGIMDVIKKRIAAAGIKNANIVVIPPPPIRGIGQAAGFSMQIEQGNTNDDVYAFENVVKKFVAEAHKNPAINTAFSYYGAHTPSYDLTLDREKCEKMGVNISDVFTTMQAYMGSLFVNNLTLYNRTFHVAVQADTTFRALISDMNKYYVRNQVGQMVPLSTLISYKATVAPPLIKHYNIFRSAEIDGSTPLGFSTGQGIEALKATADKILPQGQVP
jgi:HAE1 family hydrophobic/amphiphilic exporter-1